MMMMIIVSHILEQKVENLANVISRQASKRVELGDSEEKNIDCRPERTN